MTDLAEEDLPGRPHKAAVQGGGAARRGQERNNRQASDTPGPGRSDAPRATPPARRAQHLGKFRGSGERHVPVRMPPAARSRRPAQLFPTPGPSGLGRGEKKEGMPPTWQAPSRRERAPHVSRLPLSDSHDKEAERRLRLQESRTNLPPDPSGPFPEARGSLRRPPPPPFPPRPGRDKKTAKARGEQEVKPVPFLQASGRGRSAGDRGLCSPGLCLSFLFCTAAPSSRRPGASRRGRKGNGAAEGPGRRRGERPKSGRASPLGSRRQARGPPQEPQPPSRAGGGEGRGGCLRQGAGACKALTFSSGRGEPAASRRLRGLGGGEAAGAEAAASAAASGSAYLPAAILTPLLLLLPLPPGTTSPPLPVPPAPRGSPNPQIPPAWNQWLDPSELRNQMGPSLRPKGGRTFHHVLTTHRLSRKCCREEGLKQLVAP
ncbi:translation initiation factor IF-2-like [Trichosurus vulpecula]|uniref:translation initiation factor IF-2-like n=1 Tax=Trichosurus vulpecula TaxID=9337 RepID=UPI00186B01DE|nr:translation initiation factor IF-2-like [Trichosurus vulpecula]